MGDPVNGRTGELLRWLLGLVGAVLVSYFTAQNATNQRITVVETDVKWIRSTLDKLDGRLERVITEWGNGVDRRTGEPLPLQQRLERGDR